MFNPFTDLSFMEYMYFCWTVMFVLTILIGYIIWLL